jgi:oxygen-independent coproporphyrinogen-3 oxidase
MEERLAVRMARPQRHRLLQGYPPLPLMRDAQQPGKWRGLDGGLRSEVGVVFEPAWLALDRSRPLLVGVLPHTLCNPRLRGCGFCTFPHERYTRAGCAESVNAVRAQAGQLACEDGIAGREVAGLYFGGGTANLATMPDLAAIARVLAEKLDLTDAEVTVEGTAVNFRSWPFSPLAQLADFPGRHKRVSIGVQTFAADFLAKMGRERFGDRETVRKVVADAHKRGLTASADLLFNLPGQTLEQALLDVRAAVELGLDQICLYHLVLHDRLGTVWSRDPAMLAALPGQEQACENSCALREALLAAGFVQTTLTNFERASVHAGPSRFVYEDLSFPPEACDGLGIGPMSISTFLDLGKRRGVKLVRGMDAEARGPNLWFPYEEADLRLLFLTRELARTRISRSRHRRLFGTDFVEEHREALQAIADAKLAVVGAEDLALTPRGMFFADSIAGLLSEDRVDALRPLAAAAHTRDHVDHLKLSMG